MLIGLPSDAKGLQLIVAGGLVIIATSAAGTALAVQLAGDGVRDVGELLLLLLKVLRRGRGRVLVEPLGRLLDGIQDLVKSVFGSYRREWVNLRSPCRRHQSCRQDHPRR